MLQTMIDRARSKGIKAKPLQEYPALWQADMPYREAFEVLSKSRRMGMGGPEAIALSEIEAFCRLTGDYPMPVDRKILVELIQAMDAVFCSHSDKQAQARREAAKKG